MLGKTAGKYRIIDRIGRGSMGTVYRASDETLHRDVAIKVLNADFNDPAAGRRFRAEAIAIARLNHPGIAKIYDLFEHEGQWLMAMELVPGETLESLIASRGPLSAEEAADLAGQALLALAHAHGMGVVHRDLKPANIMVTDGQLKVMDFGIARVAGTEHLTSAGLLMGTPAYMAPEQVLGQEIDARTDIFAIGCVMFFLATAKLPFKGETAMELVQSRLNDPPTPVRTVRHELPAWFEQIVERALARDPSKRFQTAIAFRDAIGRGLSGLPLELPEIAPPAVPSDLLETAMPGSMPVPAEFGSASGQVPIVPTPASEPTALSPVALPRPSASPSKSGSGRIGLWLGAAAAVVLIGAAAAWFWPRSPVEPPPVQTAELTPTPLPSPPVESPALSPTPSPLATPTPTPTPTPVAAATPNAKPTLVATPTPSASPAATGVVAGGTPIPGAAGRRGGADATISFDTVKLLTVNGREGDVVDATLKLIEGSIVAIPKRIQDGPQVSLSFKDLLVATYVRNREPTSAPAMAAPPPDLSLPKSIGMNGLRPPVRNWLVLQGRTRYIVLALADADAKQILQALTDRRVKIDRPEAK